MPRLTDTRSHRLKLPAAGQRFEWCSEVRGFGLRLTPGSRSYVVQCRFRGKQMRITLGPAATLPFEGHVKAPGARDLAIAALNAARRGEDPRIAIGRSLRPDGLTLDGIWRAYEAAGFPKLKGVGRKRASTVYSDRQRSELLLKPHLGFELVAAIDTTRVRRWLDIIATEGQRSHALVLLKSLLSFAGSRNLTQPNIIAIAASKSREVQNFYRPEELSRLDETLLAMLAEKPAQVLSLSAIRLLVATGARLGEILSLRWDAVDVQRAVIQLEKDKTSDNRRDILLTSPAVAMLQGLPRSSSPFVFFSDSKSGHLADVQKPWLKALERAGLRRYRKHDLRHSFASAAIREGISLYTVGKLLGHRQATTTQRYAHLEQEVAREALDRIAKAVGGGR